jgi:chitinase
MRSRTKILAGAAATALAVSGVALVVVAPSASAAPVYAVAPYVDMTNNASGMLDTAIRSGGVNSYTAAFIIAAGCKPIWGDGLDINSSGVNAKIARAQGAGAKTIISFGGAGGVELAQACTSASSLANAYQSVITKYRVNHVDFDVEGAAIADPTSYNRRFQAINTLRSRNSGLVVSLTIPVLESGPDGNGETFLRAAVSNGTRIDVVNAMTMDYGHPNGAMGAAAISAAKGTLAAARRAGMNFSFRNIGITPMIGVNDTPRETFTAKNADEVIGFANSNGIGRLAFWSINRDQPCAGGGVSPVCSGTGEGSLTFTRKFTGSRGNPPPPPPPPPPGPPPPPPPPGPPPPPPPPPPGNTTWKPGVAYAVGATVTYQGIRYKCLQAHTSQVGWEPPIVPALWQPI